MAYGRSDSSGTDDDFPPPQVNRVAGGGQIGRNGRASEGMLYGRNEAEMESQVHYLEKEAYSAVLRAFIAQSDTFSWDKEGLISELRKELRVSDMEHRALLAKVNSDDVLRQIRQYRQGVLNPHASMSNSQRPMVETHASALPASGKRQRGMSSVSSLPPPVISRVQSIPEAGGKRASSRAQIERFQKDHWNDNGHEEFPPGEANYSEKADRLLPSAKKRGLSNCQKSNVRLSSQNHMHNKKLANLELRDTKKLLEKVEEVYGSAHPDPIEKEKVKAALKEHEKALIDAIALLGDICEEGHPSNAKRVKMQNNRKGNGNQTSVYNEGYMRIISERHPMPMDDGVAFDDHHDSHEDV
eukprot:TRINITY_DN828_c0_g1_i1.p1 TRINITY_DN828_c0_g1~~TRINITY_DN828_c0_g1_i1.p1  ORF type:complete len:356 (+),score=96.68 TRINITY_DN828_c0_g1_i1:280-1347(+)